LTDSAKHQGSRLIFLELSTHQVSLINKIQNITSISGIRSTTSLDKYLGFPILKRRLKRSDFHFVIEKMHTRLASWKSKLLKKPDRLALATTVLSSIPAYYMQINWLPKSICDNIDQVTRNFI